MQTKTAFVLLASLASVASVGGIGCSSSFHSSGAPEDPASTRASLHRAKGCGDLLADFKADASYKLDKAINRQIMDIVACIQHYGDAQCASYAGFGGGGFGGGGGVAVPGVAEATNAAPPTAPGATGAAPAPSAAGTNGGATGGDTAKTSTATASSYSDTNTQVKGVDEADIVKNDGKNIYVLHGNAFKVVNAWPASDLREAGSIEIEGSPTEMFVENGNVVVYSQVNGTAIFQAAGVTPKDQYQEYGYAVPDIAYAGGAPGVSSGTNIATPYPGPGYDPGPYHPLTKVTVLTLNGTTPVVAREMYYEGSFLDARRVGSQVRTVLQSFQYGPKLKYSIYELEPPTPVAKPAPDQPQGGVTYIDTSSPHTGSETIAALERLRSANQAAIDATQLPDWLPYTFVKTGAVISARTVGCGDFYVPTVGSTQAGMTEVSSIDLANPGSEPRDTAILGQAGTVYASADTLYVAANAWVEPPFFWYDKGGPVGVSNGGTAVASPPSAGAAGGASGSTPASPPSQTQAIHPLNAPLPTPAPAIVAWSSGNTHIHKFEFDTDPSFANYVASGTVIGTVKNQFSLDDKDGFLRVATSENRQYVTVDGNYFQADYATPESSGGAIALHPYLVNHLFVLGQNGPWLDVTGNAGDIAPNETLDSVRFVGTRGYLVTFRQIDPLFVFDLAVPQKPTLLASLTMTGFSEYMQPIDDNHLLTIGRNVVGNEPAGLQLQIFDVTDGARPAVVQRFTYTGNEYGSSAAEYDHKAFTWFGDKGLLAFPYYAYNAQTPTGMRSSLEIFKVDVTGGFSKLGSVDSTSLIQKSPLGYCGGYFQPEVRRGVFLENFVYAVSYGGIVVRDSNNLAAPGAQVSLPNPELNTGYGPACPPIDIGVPTPVVEPTPAPAPAPLPPSK